MTAFPSNGPEKFSSTGRPREDLCFADDGVLRLYGCNTLDELRELNGEILSEDADNSNDRRLWEIAIKAAESRENVTAGLTLNVGDGKKPDVSVEADYIGDELDRVKSIISLSKKT